MIDMMRLSDILSQINPNALKSSGPQPSPNMPYGGAQQQPTVQNDDMMQQILQLFQPNEEQFNNLSNTVGAMPQRSQYQPGLMDKISAYAAGLGTGAGAAGHYGGVPVGFQGDVPGGIKLQKAMLDEPYNKTMNDWEKKVEPLGKLASLEGSRNVNSRITGTSMMNNERMLRQQDLQQGRAEAKNDIDREKLEIQRGLAKIKEYKMMHPDLKSVTDDQGMLILWNPQDGTTTETGIDTGKMSDADKIDAQIEGRLKVAQEQHKSRLSEIGARGGETRKNEENRQENRKELESIKSTTKTEKPQTPAAERTDRINRVISIVNQNPALSKYFVFTGGNVPTGMMVEPTGKDVDLTEYERAKGMLEARTGDIKLPSSNKSQPLVSPQSKGAETGRVRITDGNGHFGSVTVEDSQKLPAPWKVVGK
jgi:hypothetical protein